MRKKTQKRHELQHKRSQAAWRENTHHEDNSPKRHKTKKENEDYLIFLKMGVKMEASITSDQSFRKQEDW